MQNTPTTPNPPPQPTYVYVQNQQGPKTDGLAVAGMVLGICGFIFGWLYLIPCIVGLVLSGVALHRINQQPERRSGKGMAITGLTCSIISLAIYGLIFLAAIGSTS